MHVCNMKCALRATTVSIVRACVHVYVHREVHVDACVQHEMCTTRDNSKYRACVRACVCSLRGACGCMCAT